MRQILPCHVGSRPRTPYHANQTVRRKPPVNRLMPGYPCGKRIWEQAGIPTTQNRETHHVHLYNLTDLCYNRSYAPKSLLPMRGRSGGHPPWMDQEDPPSTVPHDPSTNGKWSARHQVSAPRQDPSTRTTNDRSPRNEQRPMDHTRRPHSHLVMGEFGV